jgi:hypothetical protein
MIEIEYRSSVPAFDRRESTKSLSVDSLYPGRESTQARPEYEPTALPVHQAAGWCSRLGRIHSVLSTGREAYRHAT